MKKILNWIGVVEKVGEGDGFWNEIIGYMKTKPINYEMGDWLFC
jgi:hypothetical protein